jgi:phosphoglucomutase
MMTSLVSQFLNSLETNEDNKLIIDTNNISNKEVLERLDLIRSEVFKIKEEMWEYLKFDFTNLDKQAIEAKQVSGIINKLQAKVPELMKQSTNASYKPLNELNTGKDTPKSSDEDTSKKTPITKGFKGEGGIDGSNSNILYITGAVIVALGIAVAAWMLLKK